MTYIYVALAGLLTWIVKSFVTGFFGQKAQQDADDKQNQVNATIGHEQSVTESHNAEATIAAAEANAASKVNPSIPDPFSIEEWNSK